MQKENISANGNILKKLEESISSRTSSLSEATLNYLSRNSVDKFLSELDHYKVLSREEEVDLAKLIEDGKKAKYTLEATGKKNNSLEKRIEDGEKAREYMVLHNLRLVVSIAKRFQGKHDLTMGDLIQEGTIGLMKGINKFDYKKGFKVSTYATWWIRQNIERAVVNKSRTIRLPVHAHHSVRKIIKEKDKFRQENNIEPTSKEIAERIGMNKKKVEFLSRISAPTRSLDMEFESNNGHDSMNLMRVVDDGSKSVSDEVEIKMMFENARSFIEENFDPRTQNIIYLRFGLNNHERHYLRKIGEKYGLTRERIRQILNEALGKLRQAYKDGLI
jgi:RNA polymerase sigma factor (sigma-70 family)